MRGPRSGPALSCNHLGREKETPFVQPRRHGGDRGETQGFFFSFYMIMLPIGIELCPLKLVVILCGDSAVRAGG